LNSVIFLWLSFADLFRPGFWFPSPISYFSFALVPFSKGSLRHRAHFSFVSLILSAGGTASCKAILRTHDYPALVFFKFCVLPGFPAAEWFRPALFFFSFFVIFGFLSVLILTS